MAKQLIGSIDIISASWRNLVKNWRLYAELVVWSIFISLLFWTIGIMTRGAVPDRIIARVIYTVATLPVSLFAAIISVAFIDLTAKTLQDKEAAVRESMMNGVHKLFSFIWVFILLMVVNAFGMLLLIFPAIIFAVWFAFSTNELVVDGVKGRAALAASHELVSGRWWSVMWRLLLPGAFVFLAIRFSLALAYLLLGSVLGNPGLFFGPVPDLYALSHLHTLAITLIPQLFFGFGLAMFTTANLVLWFDLKKKPLAGPAKQ